VYAFTLTDPHIHYPQADADQKIEELVQEMTKLEKGLSEHAKGCAEVVDRFEAIIGRG